MQAREGPEKADDRAGVQVEKRTQDAPQDQQERKTGMT